MLRTTVFLVVAALGMAKPVAAQDVGISGQITMSVETFESICLAAVPAFPKDAKVFAPRGYVKATKDQAVFGNLAGGLAGLGYAGVAGGPTTSSTPNGCLVYFQGLETDRAAALMDAAMAKRFKIIERKKINSDSYWVVRDFAPRRFIAFVAPKPEGDYAGHTLLMITEQPLEPSRRAKAPPIAPIDPATSAAMLERLKKMSPEDRIAYFGSQQFAQCLLATSFLDIEFDKELGVERVKSSDTGQNKFIDSTTGNFMVATAKECIVAYRGTNVELALEGIKPILSLRDKNPQGTSHDNGYVIKLNMEGKPHVIVITRGEVQGASFVRMMLSEAPLQ